MIMKQKQKSSQRRQECENLRIFFVKKYEFGNRDPPHFTKNSLWKQAKIPFFFISIKLIANDLFICHYINQNFYFLFSSLSLSI